MLRKLSIRSFSAFSRALFSSDVSKNAFQSVIGLEVHAQLISKSKLFSGAANDRNAPANSVVSLFDAATPGTLPRLNKKCVEQAVKTAFALGCQVNEISTFDRKHYFYADSPAGYQITQQRNPIAINGDLSFYVLNTKTPYKKTSKIKQIQLEQDSGKSLHFPETRTSLVDLNRAGVPLIEIVFEPDLSTGEEAAALLKELSLILMKLETCSCEMFLGAFRCDANISIHKKGEPLGTRTEVKNIASYRGVAKAIEYEIQRQIKIIEAGDKVVNETRNWDADTNSTIAMRDKEVVQDYRFMPEPNLPPLSLKCIDLNRIKNNMPELPEQTREHLRTFGLPIATIETLIRHTNLLNLFNSSIREISDPKVPKIAGNLISICLLASCNNLEIDVDNCLLTPANFVEVAKMVLTSRTSNKMAEMILDKAIAEPSKCVHEIIEIYGLKQINDPIEIEKICLAIMEANPKSVRRFRNGKHKEFHKLLHRIIESNETIHTGLTSEILRKSLNENKSNE